jgi:hypothetical protein
MDSLTWKVYVNVVSFSTILHVEFLSINVSENGKERQKTVELVGFYKKTIKLVCYFSR